MKKKASGSIVLEGRMIFFSFFGGKNHPFLFALFFRCITLTFNRAPIHRALVRGYLVS